MSGSFIGTVLTGIALIGGVYLLLNNSKGVSSIAGGAVKAASTTEKAFQGRGA